MKRIIIALMLTALPVIEMFADDVRFLVLNAKDGVKTTFALAENPKISFSNDELNIVTSTKTFSISLADIQNYAFSEESTGIREVIREGIVKLEKGFIIFNGLVAGSKIVVYMQDGRIAKESQANVNGLAILDLSSLPKGILILKSSKTSIKVINK